MFCKLGFDRFEGQLSAEEHIKLLAVIVCLFKRWHTNYQFVILQISKYLDFKIGEVWSELSTELFYDRVRPISPDAEILSQIQSEIEYKANMVLKKQLEAADKKVFEVKADEAQFLNEVQAQQARQYRRFKQKEFFSLIIFKSIQIFYATYLFRLFQCADKLFCENRDKTFSAELKFPVEFIFLVYFFECWKQLP